MSTTRTTSWCGRLCVFDVVCADTLVPVLCHTVCHISRFMLLMMLCDLVCAAATMPMKLDAARDSEQERVAVERAAVLGCAPEQVPHGAMLYPSMRNGKSGSTSKGKSDGGTLPIT